MKKAPKWGNRHFCQVNWVEDELFLDSTGKGLLEAICPGDVSFRNVKDKRGDEPWSDFYQLIIPTVLKEGLIPECAAVGNRTVCPKCRTVKYLPSGIGMLKFKRDVFEHTAEIVKSSEIFGSGCIAARCVLVKQNIYRALIQKQLDRGLVFSPIELC